jgi:hypothetical protein
MKTLLPLFHLCSIIEILCCFERRILRSCYLTGPWSFSFAALGFKLGGVNPTSQEIGSQGPAPSQDVVSKTHVANEEAGTQPLWRSCSSLIFLVWVRTDLFFFFFFGDSKHIGEGMEEMERMKESVFFFLGGKRTMRVWWVGFFLFTILFVV